MYHIEAVGQEYRADRQREAAAYRLQKQARQSQPGRIRSAVKGIVRFARHLNQQKASQQGSEVRVRLSRERYA